MIELQQTSVPVCYPAFKTSQVTFYAYFVLEEPPIQIKQ